MQEWVHVMGSDPDFSGAIRVSYPDDLAGPPEVIALERKGRAVRIRRTAGPRVLSVGHGLVPEYEILGAA